MPTAQVGVSFQTASNYMHRKQILENAIECVCKDRNATHGNPEDNFATIAAYWTTYLRSQQVKAVITSIDVAAMMILVKLARIAISPSHPDHWIDAAGYAACGGGIATEGLKAPTITGMQAFVDVLEETDAYPVYVCLICDYKFKNHYMINCPACGSSNIKQLE